MGPHADVDSDWSDPDDDDRSDLETSVLLGIPDGAIEKQGDLDDAAVSRVGGHPAFLPSTEPLFSSSQCKNCSFPMELLVQLWCPFEESTMDRALYVFGCARGECQHKDGSVRAFRGLRFNAAYAAKLEKKRAHQREKEATREKAKKEEEERKAAAKVNPFSMKANSTPSGGLFCSASTFGTSAVASGGIDPQLFDPSITHDAVDDAEDESGPPPSDTEESASESESDSDGDDDSESDKSLLTAPVSTSAATSAWRAAPAYVPPLFLSTAAEYVPPPPTLKTSGVALDDTLGDIGNARGKSRKAEERRDEREEKERAAWDGAMEGYEDSMELDKVFERFARRVRYEGKQCIRYELGGTPLPYAHDPLFASLFPSLSSSSASTTPQSKADAVLARRTYDPQSAAIMPCQRCGGARVFECQLMPHLISVLEGQDKDASGDDKCSSKESVGEKDGMAGKKDGLEERRQKVERLLRGGGGKRGMEWGTCMVFSCERDCCREDQESWLEELVLVQWED